MPRFCFLLLLVTAAAEARAQDAIIAPPAYGSSYREIRTWHEKQNLLGPTPEQRLSNLRTVVRSRVGQRGLERLYGNFTGSRNIDPRIPGVEQTVRLSSSSNPNVAKGYRRALLYATKLHHDPRFKLLELNRPQRGATGKLITDKDIWYRHLASGAIGRIEVKDVSVASQRANLAYYQRQMDKMAAEFRRTGELQAWMNRKAIIPELRDYARQRGIPTYGNVVTGDASARVPGTMSVGEALQDIDRHHNRIGLARRVGAGAQIGFGALLLSRSLPLAVHDARLLLDAEQRSAIVAFRFGEHAGWAVSGASSLGVGTAQLVATFTSNEQRLASLTRASRTGGMICVAAFLAAEGFSVLRYAQGDITQRQFLAEQSSLAAGLGGSVAGAWVGAKVGAGIGVWIGGPVGAPVGGTLGAVVGGVAGGYTASAIALHGLQRWFDLRDEQQAGEYQRFLYSHYSLGGN